MNFKNFLPPIIVEFLRNNQRVVKYKSYEEAFSHCSVNAYQNEELCNMIADKTLIHIDKLNKKPFTLNPTSVYLSFALNYLINEMGERRLTVLDFGGACGAHYFELRNIIPQSISLKWIVVETKQMIQSAVSHNLENEELYFLSDLDDISEKVDFIHSSGTLQYVPTPYDFLKRLVGIKAKMILLNRMMFNNDEYDFITIQRSHLSANGPGILPVGYIDKPIMYPHSVLSFSKFNKTILDAGYECLSEFDESSGIFSLGKEEILGKGLFYIKK